MNRLLLAVTLLLCPACLATSSDIREIADAVSLVEAQVADESATVEDVQEALVHLRETSEEVAERIDERTAEGLDAVKGLNPVDAGLTLGGLLALNWMRDRKRKQRGEAV